MDAGAMEMGCRVFGEEEWRSGRESPARSGCASIGVCAL